MEIRSCEKVGIESGEQLYQFTFAVPEKDIDGNNIVLAKKETRSKESIQVDLEAHLKRVEDFQRAATDCQALLDAIPEETE